MKTNELNLRILHWQIIEDLPSASGIVKFKEDFFVIGDDSPYLFQLDKDFNLVSKTLIYSAEKLLENRISKIEKADFEAMEMVSENELLIFGSGSKSPQRDVCVWIELGKEIIHQEYDISVFYNYLRNLEIMKGHELNIEGLCIKEDWLYLFNRGRNIIFSFSCSEFMAYCRTGSQFPLPKTQLFSLPKIKGLEAGFSGATAFKDLPYFIFTAAVEDSPNAYDDGEIHGSFLGLIKRYDSKFDEDFLIKQIPSPGFPLKVESVIIDEIISLHEIDLVLVTDNDGKPSQIIRLRLNLSKELK